MTALADSKYYTPAEVAAATSVSVETQNQRYARRVFHQSRRDSIPNGSGDVRLVCIETVYNIAITAACSKLNIPARQAAKAARLFADDQPGRAANELFKFGRSLMVMKSTGAQILHT